VSISAPRSERELGGVLPQPISFQPNRDGITIIKQESTPLLRQGGIFDIGLGFVSVTQIERVLGDRDITTRQGSTFSNGIFYSKIVLGNQNNVNQGNVILQKNITTREQGGEDPIKVVAIQDIESRQGIFIINSKKESGIVPLLMEPKTLQTPLLPLTKTVGIDPQVPASIKIVQSAPSDTYVEGQSPTLHTLRFVAIGAGLSLTPTAFQGFTTPENQPPTETAKGTGHIMVSLKASTVGALLNPIDPGDGVVYSQAEMYAAADADGVSVTGNTLRGVGGATYASIPLADAPPKLYGNIDKSNGYVGGKSRQAVQLLSNSADELGTNSTTTIYDKAFGQGQESVDAISDNGTDFQKNAIKRQNLNAADDKLRAEGKGFISDTNQNEKVTSALGIGFDGVDGLSDINNVTVELLTPSLEKIKNNFKVTDAVNGAASWKRYKYVTDYSQLQGADGGSLNKEGAIIEGDVPRREKTIKISDYDGGGSVTFTAFIKTLSDNVTATYTDYKQIGWQDTFKVFTGVTRQISLGLTVLALGPNDPFASSARTAAQQKQQLNKLIQICTVGSAGTNGYYIKGPTIRLSASGLFKDLICVCGSVKVDIPVSDTSWDVDAFLPQQYDVSLDLVPLATHGDTLITKTSNFYG